MKRIQNLLAFSLGILTACSGPQSAIRTETQTELVTLDQGADENGLCHVHYQHVDRKAPCTEIVALMRSELRIPTQAHVALRPSKTVRYEEIAQLIQSLREAGYTMRVGYINSQ
jgi:biopolymer transport protein ExbD